jgi:hypothetical protein
MAFCSAISQAVMMESFEVDVLELLSAYKMGYVLAAWSV